MSGLNEAEMQKQIKHMVKFIEKEGAEKAEEIDTKAEEEFNIEKVRLVQTEKKAIMKLAERKAKQVEVEKKIERSTQLNISRLKILKCQDEHLKAVFAKCGERLSTIAADKGRYTTIVEKLLMQGLVALLEEEVEVRCRKEDVSMVKASSPHVCKQYAEMTKKQVNLTINEKDFLPDTCGGGVELRVGSKFRLVNTLENRLELACQQTLPAVRNIMFGIGKGSRAFFD